jgi:hypothetical protein
MYLWHGDLHSVRTSSTLVQLIHNLLILKFHKYQQYSQNAVLDKRVSFVILILFSNDLINRWFGRSMRN